MESGACLPLIKPSKQNEDRDCDLVLILSSRQFTFQSHLTSLYIPTKYKFIIREFKNDYHFYHEYLNRFKINHPI